MKATSERTWERQCDEAGTCLNDVLEAPDFFIKTMNFFSEHVTSHPTYHAMRSCSALP